MRLFLAIAALFLLTFSVGSAKDSAENTLLYAQPVHIVPEIWSVERIVGYNKKWADEWRWHFYTDIQNNTKHIGKFLAVMDYQNFFTPAKLMMNELHVLGFMRKIFKNNPDQIKNWLETEYSTDTKRVLLKALMLEDLEDKAPESYQSLFDKNDPEIAHLKAYKVERVNDMDHVWGSFQATGDAKFIDMLIDGLDDDRQLDMRGLTAQKMTVSDSLKDMLAVHVIYHTRVEQYLKNLLKTSTGKRQQHLEQIIKLSKEGLANAQGPKDRKGDFFPFIRDVSHFGEHKDGIKSSDYAEIKVGHNIYFRADIFGVPVDENFNANTVYDFIIKDPAGKIAQEYNNVPCVEGFVKRRFVLLPPKKMVQWHIPKDAMPGEYSATMIVHDKITGQKTQTTTKFTVNGS